MKFVQEWCKGKPPILRIVAKVTAFGPEDLHWGLERLYQRDLPNVFPVPADPIVWHACYNRETALVDCFLRLLFNDDQYVFRRLKELREYMRFIAVTPQEIVRDILSLTFSQITQGEWQFLLARGSYFWQRLERHFDRLLFDDRTNAKPSQHLLTALATPEFQFFARVYTPCFMAYKTTPKKLLEASKNPDPKIAIPALSKLLPLDPSLASIAPFNQLLHQFRHDPARTLDYHRLTYPLRASTHPFPRMRLAKIKSFGAATVAMVAKVLRIRLTKKELWKLEEAIAKDRGARRPVDLRTYDDYRKPVEREERELFAMIAAGTFSSSPLSQ